MGHSLPGTKVANIAKSSNKSHGPFHQHRVGEGVLVDVSVKPTAQVEGSGAVELSADITNVPVPSKRYSADVCFIGYSHETVKLLFAQETYGTADLQTLLIVKMTPSSAERMLKTMEQVSAPTFAELAEKAGIEAEEIGDFVGSAPKETVAFNASFVLVAMSGREACIDFYHASPFSIGAAANTKKLALDPVVRVDLRSALVMGLMKQLRSVLNHLPHKLLELTHD